MSSRFVRGPLVFSTTTVKTGSGDVTVVNESVVIIDKSSGAATGVTLPAPTIDGRAVYVKDGKGDAATNNITISPDGVTATTIEGAGTYVISENFGSVLLIWHEDVAEWVALSVGAPLSSTELGFLNGITAGTGLASKALVLDASGNVVMPDNGVVGLSRAAVAAAGTTSADAAVLADQVNAVTGADGAKGVALPAAATTEGPIWVINTNINFDLLVYPVDSGDDQINELAANVAFTLPPRSAACFIPTSATQWYCDNFASGSAPTAQKSILFEDFRGTWTIGDAGPADLWSSTAGSGTGNELATTVANSINGEVTLKSASDDGANSANNTTLTGINLGYKANQGGLAIEVQLKIDDITEAYIFVGFTDVISTTVESPISFTDGTDTLIADADNACGIVFTGDSTTQEFAHGGVKATTPTAGAFGGVAPVNDTYITLRVEVSSAGAVRGFVNGAPIGAAVANAITASTAVTPAVIVGNTAAAQTIMTIDYVKVEQNR